MKDTRLEQYLAEHGIDYTRHEHEPVETVEEAQAVRDGLPDMFPAKNLLVEDGSGRFYLVAMYAEERLDMDRVADILDVDSLSLASPDALREELGVTPGSASAFSMIRAENTVLVVDERVWAAETVGFHPNTNTATLELSHEDFATFYNTLDCEKHIIDLQ